ncbi:MAG: hypothetical protein FWC42_10155 [Proteobacteria bacterium]|nr:hypothetical protein [Pseudomonadota bacterium]
MVSTNALAEGDICTFQQSNGAWGFFWVLKMDKAPDGEKIFSLKKFDAYTDEEVLKEYIDDVEELKGLPLQGHFPICEKQVLECKPRIIGNMSVSEDDLEGYSIWKTAFDKGEAGVFTLPVEEI